MRVSYKKRNKTKYFISAFIAITTLAGILSLTILRGSYAELGETEQTALETSADAGWESMKSADEEYSAYLSPKIEFFDQYDNPIDYASLGSPSNANSSFQMKITNPSAEKPMKIERIIMGDSDSDKSIIRKPSGWQDGTSIGYGSSATYSVDIGVKAETSQYSDNINEVKQIQFKYSFENIYEGDSRTPKVFTQNEYIAIVGRYGGPRSKHTPGEMTNGANMKVDLGIIEPARNVSNNMYIGEVSATKDGEVSFNTNNNMGTYHYSADIYIDNSVDSFNSVGKYIDTKANSTEVTMDSLGIMWEFTNDFNGGFYPNRTTLSIDDTDDNESKNLQLSINGSPETSGTKRAVTNTDIQNSYYETSSKVVSGNIHTVTANGTTISTDFDANRDNTHYVNAGLFANETATGRMWLSGNIPSIPEGSDHATIRVRFPIISQTNANITYITRATVDMTFNIYRYDGEGLSSSINMAQNNLPVRDYINPSIFTEYDNAIIAAKKAFVDVAINKSTSGLQSAISNLNTQYAALENNLYTEANIIKQNDVLKKNDYSSSEKELPRISYHVYNQYKYEDGQRIPLTNVTYSLPYDTDAVNYKGYATYYDDVDDHIYTKYSKVATGTINSNHTAEYDYWKIDMSSYETALAALNTEIADVNEKYTDESKVSAAAARDEIVAFVADLNNNRNSPTEQASINGLVNALNDLLVTGSSDDKLVYKYKVTFKNYDGTDLATIYVAKDTVLNADSYKGETPTKPSTVDLVYSWSGWNPALGDAITEDKEYTATFASSTRKYAIELINKKTNNEESGDTYDLESFCTFEVEYGSTWDFGDCKASDPNRSANYQYEFSFDGWSSSENGSTRSAQSPLTGASETDIITKYYAIYSKTTKKYNAVFKDGDGDTLKTTLVDYGATPVYDGDEPTKAKTPQYSYSWNGGWNPALSTQTRETTYEATFNNVDNKYWVTFLDEDKTAELYKTQVVYGQSPVYGGAKPTKESDVQYDYEFKGWRLLETEDEPTKELPALTCSATSDFDDACKKTYIAVYEGYKRHYNVYYYDDDKITLLHAYDVDPDEGEEYIDDNGIEHKFRITYGENAPFEYIAPKEDDRYEYIALGWCAADSIECYLNNGYSLPTVTRDNMSYIAKYIPNPIDYPVYFYKGDVSILSKDYHYGQTPSYNGPIPSKESDAQYTYEFAGWSRTQDSETVDNPEFTALTADDKDGRYYYAVFSKTLQSYTIKFVDEDGTVLQSSEWNYGTTPVYNGETPTKASDNYYNYTFKGWDKTISTVTGEETYTATYNKEDVYYTVAFYDEDGSLLTSDDEYTYGQEINFLKIEQNDKAVNPDDHDATSFAGWATEKYGDVEVEKGSINTTRVSGNVNYYAIYNYTVNFYDEDGTQIGESQVLHSNKDITFPADPTKEDATSFAGWAEAQYGDVVVPQGNEDAIKALKNVNYYAIYNYTVNFYDEDGTQIEGTQQVLRYNDIIEFPTDPTNDDAYAFAGWATEQYGDVIVEQGNEEEINIVSDIDYYAIYDYSVSFKDYDSRIISEKFNYRYGDTVEVPTDPTREGNVQYTYIFKGWNPEVKVVEGNEEYVAEYEEITNEYEITFEDEFGNILQKSNVKYGETPVYEGEIPTKETTPSFKYKFVSWNDGLEPVTGEATYRPKFEAIPYEISFEWTKNQEYTIGQDNESVFHIDVELKFFEHIVEVDGKEIKEGIDYTSSNGSTVITLNKNFLDTLAVGKHTMDVYYDGEVIVSTTFTILEPADVPDTGLVSNIKSFVTNGFGIFSLILAAIAGTTIWAVRKSHRK